jgi:hypothetical protein
MPVGSTYAVVKDAIVTKLRAREALSGITIQSQPPTRPEEIKSEDGSGKAIWLADAEGSYTQVVMGAPGLWIDETYDLTLVIQSLPVDTDDTQLTTDTRVDEMLYEVLNEAAADPTCGITQFNFVEIAQGTFERFCGPYTNAVQFPSRIELALNVVGRIRFTGT